MGTIASVYTDFTGLIGLKSVLNTRVYTFTGVAVGLIFPQETASSGRAPESLPSNSWAVLRNTEKSAPLRLKRTKNKYNT